MENMDVGMPFKPETSFEETRLLIAGCIILQSFHLSFGWPRTIEVDGDQ
jgi:hypothetical protein